MCLKESVHPKVSPFRTDINFSLLFSIGHAYGYYMTSPSGKDAINRVHFEEIIAIVSAKKPEEPVPIFFGSFTNSSHEFQPMEKG